MTCSPLSEPVCAFKEAVYDLRLRVLRLYGNFLPKTIVSKPTSRDTDVILTTTNGLSLHIDLYTGQKHYCWYAL